MAQTVEQIEKKIAQLQARKKDLLAQENKANRKRRNHALMSIGAQVESIFEHGWLEIGMGKLSSYMQRHRAEIVAECSVEPLDPSEADKRLRDWERAVREKKAAAQTNKQTQPGKEKGREEHRLAMDKGIEKRDGGKDGQ